MQFDTISRSFSADISAEDGTTLSLTCNGKTETAVVADNKIELTFVTPFHNGTQGGTSYPVTVSNEDYGKAVTQIAYWPKVSATISCGDEENLFIGGINGTTEPVFTVCNYAEADVTKNISFKIYSTETYKDSATRTALTTPDTTGWTFSDMLTYLSDSENAGKTVEMHYSLSPKAAAADSELDDSGYIVYNCKAEKLVKSAHIVQQFGRFEARLFAESVAEITSVTETAGGTVTYQWQASDDAENFTDIPGATAKTFVLTKENCESLLNKTLRVKLTQTFAEAEQQPVYSTTYPVYHTIKDYTLYYDAMLLRGDTFNTAEIKGRLTDELGNTYDAGDFHWNTISEQEEKDHYTAKDSGNFYVSCTKENFYDAVLPVFANVQAILSEDELPQLSVNTAAITAGKASFDIIDSDLEVSFNGGATYVDIPEDDFDVSAESELLFRTKTFGTPDTSGYVRESSAKALTVKTENIGTNASGSGLISDFEMQSLTLKKKTSNGVTTITPILNYTNSGCAYEYTWLIDGADARTYSGTAVNAKHALVITNSAFGKDAYQIYCMVRIYVPDSDEETELGTVSEQISLAIK
ncbi:MAG: hypothetical protein K6G80_11130 [Treponema sp.]|nr:hypothetical protein [Treponema sp.]